MLKSRMRMAVIAALFLATLACRTANVFIAQATEVPPPPPTRSRPTFTPNPTATDTPLPTKTPLPTTTRRPTARPPTPRPPTPIPIPQPVAVAPTAIPAPTVSTMEFHARQLGCSNPTITTNSGTFLKGTVYNDRNNPGDLYAGAIVALGSPDGNTIYQIVQTGDTGQYTFILSDPGVARPGTWAIWLVDPSRNRKSDIGEIGRAHV
jgi:hypothetical protein